MVQRCNNVCERFRVSRNPRGGPIESQGLAYCSNCEEHMEIESLLPKNFCQCCKAKVRRRSRYGSREPNWRQLFDWLFSDSAMEIPELINRWYWGRIQSINPFICNST